MNPISDYALDLFMGKTLHVQDNKTIPAVSKVNPLSFPSQHLGLTLEQAACIAALDNNTYNKLAELVFTNQIAQRAILHYEIVLLSASILKIKAIRQLLIRLDLIEPLKGYYRYWITTNE